MNKYIFLLFLIIFAGCAEKKPETKSFPKKWWLRDDPFSHIEQEIDDDGNVVPVWREDE
jgi:hypothetical protein